MKHMIKAVTEVLIISSFIPLSVYSQFWTNDGSLKTIYGKDNRIDYFQASPEMKTLADSVVSLWKSADVQYEQLSKSYVLKTRKFADVVNLAPEERFREQPKGAFCSGSLVAKDIIMTAGHCITTEEQCKDTKFIFGFAIKKDGVMPLKIPEGDVYSCKKIVAKFMGDEPDPSNPEGQNLGADYALVQIDKAAKNRTPLKINRKQKIENGTSLFVIGHPVGLPLKIADDASVRDASPQGYFVANLDTFGGNSGSPVFNAKTKLVEGILVRGDTDFDQGENGAISHVNPQNGGRGEDVTKISVLANLIPGKKKTSKDATAESGEEIQPQSAEIPVSPINFEDVNTLQEDILVRFFPGYK
jgi:V8-like Glu-specific endopeptidase